MNKTLFIDESSTEKVDLGDGFWVEIPKEISYDQSEEFGKFQDCNLSQMQIGKKMMVVLIKKWNITDIDGKVSEINEKNLGRLSILIVNKIMEAITPKLDISKKKSPI